VARRGLVDLDSGAAQRVGGRIGAFEDPTRRGRRWRGGGSRQRGYTTGGAAAAAAADAREAARQRVARFKARGRARIDAVQSGRHPQARAARASLCHGRFSVQRSQQVAGRGAVVAGGDGVG
jgi:hypothetical protein